jgi:hypothetical protein
METVGLVQEEPVEKEQQLLEAAGPAKVSVSSFERSQVVNFEL